MDDKADLPKRLAVLKAGLMLKHRKAT